MMILFSFLLPACESTYKKDTLKESVQELAKKEYKLDVDVAQVGKTLGARFRVPQLVSEIYSGNDEIYTKMNGLFTILARVGLSSDVSPEFIVLDIVDEENPDFRLLFTRHMTDVRKSMAEALSYSQSQDRLIQEFVINGKHIMLDPEEMDFLRVMMLAADTPEKKHSGLSVFSLKEVHLDDFLLKVIENTSKRLLREKRDVKDEVQIHDVAASFSKPQEPKNKFKVLLDLAARPSGPLTVPFLETHVLPLIADEVRDIFKSYRFEGFSDITVIETNSGAQLILPAR